MVPGDPRFWQCPAAACAQTLFTVMPDVRSVCISAHVSGAPIEHNPPKHRHSGSITFPCTEYPQSGNVFGSIITPGHVLRFSQMA
jgi:hypothetical protein